MGNVQIASTLQNKAGQKKSIFNSSSTVFLAVVNSESGIDTEISLLNHFVLKRGITDVVATIDIRDLNGDLIKSLKVHISEKRVYSFRLSDHIQHEFIGSIYVFFNSGENLAVPFCAVMCAIRTSNSICGVHTYGRRLEQKELGTEIDLHSTIETGWTLRDRRDVQSFAVLHGSQFELDLDIRIECTNHLGDDLIIETSHKLLPFGTLMLLPQELCPKIVEHLDGEMGHAKVHIDGLSGVFPRMLCGNFMVGEKQSSALTTAQELQFTHTNFDFSSIVQPDSISPLGYYNQPSLPDGYGIVYPVETKKQIEIDGKDYISGSIHHIEIAPVSQVEVKAEGENLPSRFVAAAIGIWDSCVLESECSTGTFVEDYLKVPCHWHWGLLKPGLDNGDSKISIILNKFNRNESLERKVKFQVFDEEQCILEREIMISETLVIDVMDLLPRKLPDGALWYVLSGAQVEDLNIFSTFYPEGKAGFTEHAF